VTNNRAAAGVWLMFAAACGLVATFLAWRGTSESNAAASDASVEPAR
jgi:hypothetical protein